MRLAPEPAGAGARLAYSTPGAHAVQSWLRHGRHGSPSPWRWKEHHVDPRASPAVQRPRQPHRERLVLDGLRRAWRDGRWVWVPTARDRLRDCPAALDRPRRQRVPLYGTGLWVKTCAESTVRRGDTNPPGKRGKATLEGPGVRGPHMRDDTLLLLCQHRRLGKTPVMLLSSMLWFSAILGSLNGACCVARSLWRARRVLPRQAGRIACTDGSLYETRRAHGHHVRPATHGSPLRAMGIRPEHGPAYAVRANDRTRCYGGKEVL